MPRFEHVDRICGRWQKRYKRKGLSAPLKAARRAATVVQPRARASLISLRETPAPQPPVRCRRRREGTGAGRVSAVIWIDACPRRACTTLSGSSPRCRGDQ
jgi:hypothetical protein